MDVEIYFTPGYKRHRASVNRSEALQCPLQIAGLLSMKVVTCFHLDTFFSLHEWVKYYIIEKKICGA
jgi:hypothetical protein